MNDLAVIALTRWERQQLAAIWQFFPFRAGSRWHYLYAGQEDSEELPEHPAFLPQAFSGADPVAAMEEFVATAGITELCFASLGTQQRWARATGTSSITLYESAGLSLADLSTLDEGFTARIDELCRALDRHPAILRAEVPILGSPKDGSIYVDFDAYRRACYGELLCTRNHDLVSAVCHSSLASFTVRHHWRGRQALNLALDEEKVDFLAALNRLRQAGAEAAENTDGNSPGTPSAYQASYSLFAQYYDSYMSHVNYEQWVDLILSWHKRVTRTAPKRILELACGTANASEILVFRGFEVDACDLSPYMLHIAESKPFKPSLFLNSLTDPIPGGGYDLVFCLFDSFNYLVKKAEAAQLLTNAYAALNPGGTFIFDISTLHNSLENFCDTTSFNRVRDGYLIQISSYEPLTYRQITHFFLFRKNLNAYERFEERHVQRVYRTSELIELCAASKLQLKAIFAPDTRPNLLSRDGNDLDNRYFRLFFLLQKPL
ncbi:MAG TPA: methyltransferase domain-containing protein [Candidatus Syntrophosphaera sp.]|nr:methyltransferase domain-containing protein [Candidatus Syntrophosphaera sp.]